MFRLTDTLLERKKKTKTKKHYAGQLLEELVIKNSTY